MAQQKMNYLNGNLLLREKKIKIQLDPDDVVELTEQLSSLVLAVTSVEKKRAEAEIIYKELKSSGIKMPDLPWTPKSWHNSKLHDFCAICNAEFSTRQNYVYRNGKAVCRHKCPGKI